MNVSATLSIFRLIRDPALCLPHHTVPTFQQLPVPISQAFSKKEASSSNAGAPAKAVDIRAVVLDKDNCFAAPGENHVHPPYEEKLKELREAYPGAKLLIVSNSAGTRYSDPGGRQVQTHPDLISLASAQEIDSLRYARGPTLTTLTQLQASVLEESTGIPVLRHATKKPGTYPSILEYFTDSRNGASSGVTHASQIVVVGDRLFTDVMMANMMGSWSIWVRNGVVQEHGLVHMPWWSRVSSTELSLLFRLALNRRSTDDAWRPCSLFEQNIGSKHISGVADTNLNIQGRAWPTRLDDAVQHIRSDVQRCRVKTMQGRGTCNGSSSQRRPDTTLKTDDSRPVVEESDRATKRDMERQPDTSEHLIQSRNKT